MVLPCLPCGPLMVDDLWSREHFLSKRADLLPEILCLKAQRRLPIGPHATVLFESKILIWWQIQEMLRIESGAHPEEELMVYRCLMPTDRCLSMSLFLEFPEPEERRDKLILLAGLQDHVFFRFGPYTVPARSDHAFSEKASAVNFQKICFTPDQKDLFCRSFVHSTLSIEHPVYTHSGTLSKDLWMQLVLDM